MPAVRERELLRIEEVSTGPTGARRAARLPALASVAFLLGLLALAVLAVGGGSRGGRGPDAGRGTVPSPSAILERRLQELARGDEPGQEFALRMSAGHVHRAQGHYAQAGTHYAAARDLAEAHLGGGDSLAAALQALGLAHHLQGKLLGARQDLEASLRLTGDDGMLSPGTLQALGNVRRDLGHLDDAIRLYERARVAAARREEAERMPLLATELGEAHARRGEVEQAMAYFREAIRQKEAVDLRLHQPGGAKDPEVALAQSLLGGAHHMRGEVKRAVELYQEAARIQAGALRSGHPDAVLTQVGIARAQRDLGQADIAMATVEALEKVLRSEEGKQETPDLGRVLVLKTDLLREAKRYDEAEHAAHEALEELRRNFGTDENPELAVALMEYGSLLHDQGHLLAARGQYEKALEVNLKTVGPKNPETAASHNSLGTVCQDLGDEEGAKEHFTQCLQIQLETLGPTNPDVSASYNNLATLLFRQGRASEAVALLRKGLSVLDVAGVPDGNPDRAIYEENLAEATAFLTSQTAKQATLAQEVV